MSPYDYTQSQSPADEQRSKELSLQRTRPPTEVPGYEAQRFLGAGAYGEVWVGVDRNTGRRVAIKFYAHRRGVDWSLLSREVEKLVFLSADRYVVQLLDVGWDSDPPYYVMEYVENGSLEDLLRKRGTFAPSEAVEMFREIAIGLAHAHGKGVLHCDLKPANILLDQDQRPRLADFGQSRLSHEQRPALGTLFYMAPEQADLEAVPDVRWDVYALGAILYCMLVGHPPHRSDASLSEVETAKDLPDRLSRYRRLIQENLLPDEHRQVAGVDNALADIVDRCLAPKPRDRFANVQEVLDALQARDQNRARRPLILVGFIGPLVLLAIMAFFGWRGYERALKETELVARQRAIENNTFAAELAAERVSSEIANYFEVVEDEASRSRFEALLRPVLEHESLAKINDPQARESDIQAARPPFVTDAARKALDEYLQSRLERYRDADDMLTNPRFASMFVSDRYGTQIAAAHDDDVTSRSIGKNFAHRTYFHGGAAELPPFPRSSENAKHIQKTTLSAVFKSSTTKMWKVAISTPLYHEEGDRDVFDGVLVLTVNLGDFEFFRINQEQNLQRFAVLVDGREGEDTGKILQHPLFDRLLDSRGRLPEQFPEYRVPETLLTGSSGQIYRDPLSQHEAGKEFAQQWIAAAAPVRTPGSANGDPTTGLMVLVQEDYDRVISPVQDLGRRLVREGILALCVIVVASVALWYFVLRLYRDPTGVGRRMVGALPESTPVHGMETLPIASARREP